MVFIIVSAQLGIIQDYIYSNVARVRHYLGFRYALFGPTFLFNITGLVLYVKKAKIQMDRAFCFSCHKLVDVCNDKLKIVVLSVGLDGFRIWSIEG